MIHPRHLFAQIAPTANRDAHQRAEYARTFLLIPAAQMPSLTVRHALVMRALRGEECYAAEVAGQWLVCERLAGTMGIHVNTPCQWAITYGYLAAEAAAASVTQG